MMVTVHEQASLDQVNETLCRMFDENPNLAAMLPRDARWRYYGSRGALTTRPATIYFYTSEKVQSRYVSGVYCYIKTRKVWRKRQVKRHAKKKAAMARALSLYDAATKDGGAA